MANKPKITIDNFKGIKPGGAYWLQGFAPQVYGNTSSLEPRFHSSLSIDDTDTGFSNIASLDDLVKTNLDAQSSAFPNMYGISGRYLFHLTRYANDSGGEMYNISSPTSNPSLAVTERETLLFTGEQYLGFANYFTVDTGTSTSITLKDYEGSSASTLYATYGIDDDNYNGTIFNLTKGEQYVNTTSEPTDTLNFSAADTTPAEDDEILVFIERKKQFITSTGRDIHFNGQGQSGHWHRDITQFGNDYYITNGNYLAVLQSDESTFAKEEKALPHSTQAKCISSNSDRIIVGAEFRNSGKLLLWDGESDFWNNELDTPFPITSIIPYGGNFIVVSAGVIYETDGYSFKKITELPDNSFYSANIADIKLLNNKLYIAHSGSNPYRNRLKKGLYIYDLNKRCFSFCPFTGKQGGLPTYDIDGGAILLDSEFNDFYCGSGAGLQNINFQGATTSTFANYFAQFLIPLPRKMRLNKVELNLSFPSFTYPDDAINYQTNVIVSIGDGRKGLYKRAQFGSASTTTTLVSVLEASHDLDASVGEQLIIEDSDSGLNSAGEKRFITSITDPGTSSVDYGIDQAITTAPSDTVNGRINRLTKQGSRNITVDDIDMLPNLEYKIDDFYSDKLFLEVLFREPAGESNLALSINSINIY